MPQAAPPTPPGLPATTPLRALLRLAIPVCAAQLGLKFMNSVDLMMLGHWGDGAIGAMTLGNLWAWLMLMAVGALLQAVDPQLAQAVGNRDEPAYHRALLRGLVLAAFVTIPAAVLVQTAGPVLTLLGQDPEFVPIASRYASIQAVGFLPFLWITVLRSALQARDNAFHILWVVAVGNLLNAGLDWLLIYGNWGFPELGVEGASWCTVVVRWAMCAALCLPTLPDLRGVLATWRDKAARTRALRGEAVRRSMMLGLPISLQTLMEMGVFQATTLLAGYIGAASLEGHTMTLDLASNTFMVAVGLSIAASTVVGRHIGAGNMEQARQSAKVAWLTGLLWSTLCMVVMFAIPGTLAGIYGVEGASYAVALSLLPIAGAFQLSDGLQVLSIGILRGSGDTRSPVPANFIGFWVLGLPIGCLLAFTLDLGAAGLWWGLLVGLTAVALPMAWLAWRRLKGVVDRLELD